MADDPHAVRPFQVGRPHFGYGSNMWPPWLWRDAKSARPRAEPAHLVDHRLLFSKKSTKDGSAKANVRPKRGSRVWGVLYDVDPRELRPLNIKEGGYVPKDIVVRQADGTSVNAWMYWAPKASTRRWPYRWYLDLVRKGAAHFKVPAPYRRALATRRGRLRPENDEAVKAADEARAALVADPAAPPPWPPPAGAGGAHP